jgi:hypothetical protein
MLDSVSIDDCRYIAKLWRAKDGLPWAGSIELSLSGNDRSGVVAILRPIHKLIQGVNFVDTMDVVDTSIPNFWTLS